MEEAEPPRGALRLLDRLTGAAERPFVWAGERSRLNLLHHTGPIAVLLFVVAFVTGIYLTMFFRFGFEASYAAVASMEGTVPGRFMRALHRYSSIALVVVALLHGWKTFVAVRFQKPRRTAWVTGVVMVAMVWLIGVTGYWLIWDERAQLLNEVLGRLIGGTATGLDFLLDGVVTSAAAGGWPFVLAVFLVHFLLSAAIAALLFYHLRHLARPAWLPQPRVTAVVGISLIAASILAPVGLLEPASAASLVGSVPIDPFFLFLLPAGLRLAPGPLWAAVAIVGIGATVAPFLLRRRLPPRATIDDDRCIGCTWCAADCPYEAITMIATPDRVHLNLAVVDPAKCVSCGICVGSCPTRAIDVAGVTPESLWQSAEAGSDDLILACARSLAGPAPIGTVVLRCVGMAPVGLVEDAAAAGKAVELVACHPADCAYRDGSELAAARLSGDRPPKLRKAFHDAPISVSAALPGDAAGRRPFPSQADFNWRSAAPVLGLVAVIAVASIAVGRVQLDVGGADRSAVVVTMDHQPGVPLLGRPGDLAAAATTRLVVAVDDRVVLDITPRLVEADHPNTALLWERIDVEPGVHEIAVTVVEGTLERVVFADTVALAAGEAIPIEIRDQDVTTPTEAGAAIFNNRTSGVRAGCVICHSTEPGVTLVGPSLAGIAESAATRVPGLDATAYLRQSLVDPDAYVVAGYSAGQMSPDLADELTDQQIDQLVAYLLTLRGDS